MKVTLVDYKRAREGYEFTLLSTSGECESCNLRIVCLGNLEEGRKYRVVEVRNKEHDCPIFDKVKVVEVEECTIKGGMEENKVYTGSIVTFEPITCNEIFCENYEYCIPEGLRAGDECRIEEELGKINCPLGYKLRLVSLKRMVS